MDPSLTTVLETAAEAHQLATSIEGWFDGRIGNKLSGRIGNTFGEDVSWL